MTKFPVNEPFTAAIVAVLSWTSYLDGAVWTSGACAGAAAILLVDFLAEFAACRDKLAASADDEPVSKP